LGSEKGAENGAHGAGRQLVNQERLPECSKRPTITPVLTSLFQNKELLVWLGIFSAVTFVGSLALIPVLCVRMGEDYFMPHRDKDRTLEGRHPIIRLTGLILKNVIGVLLVLAGIAMLFLPGQGVLTIIIGVMMLNFPGKRKLELQLIRLPGVLRAINHLRARAKHPPLQLPERTP
jgi:Putative transmembrane protein (PGPGW)